MDDYKVINNGNETIFSDGNIYLIFKTSFYTCYICENESTLENPTIMNIYPFGICKNCLNKLFKEIKK